MLADVPSALTHLEGSASGERYDADALIGLDPADGRPLLARYDLERAAAHAHPRGARRAPRRRPVALGGAAAGARSGAPDPPRRGLDAAAARAAARRASSACRGCCIKAEGLNPTGSFKARGMAAAVSRAAELGATALVAPSAGNAGGALAAYGAARRAAR